MSAFKFVGDPSQGGEGPNVMMAHGMRFPKGEAVAVTDEKVIAKLSGNSHFEKVDGRTTEAKEAKKSGSDKS